MPTDRLAAKSCVRTAMDALYRFCVIVAGGALVLLSAVIPWGVFTRYVLNSAASLPEPMAILMTIVLTFFPVRPVAMVLSLIAFAASVGYVMALMQVPARIMAALLIVSNDKNVILLLINVLLLV